MKKWPKEEIFHVSVDNFAQYVVDLFNRKTFGIWSIPPLMSLQTTLRWKINAILNDILWRHRSIPREHHKLNLSQFTPDRYPEKKTYAERAAAAQADATVAANKYKEGLGTDQLDTDQIYITDKDTEIGYVEPKTTTYASPNELLKQLTGTIHHATQVPVVGEKSYATAFWDVTIGITIIETMAEKIKEALERLMREHLKKKFSSLDAVELGRYEISTKLILGRERAELAKTIALLKSTESFNRDELRELFNMPKLPGGLGKEIPGLAKGKPPAIVTAADAARDAEKGPGTEPAVPEQE
jgi:BMFP domain-containing protein YqiC